MASRKHHKQDATRPTKARVRKEKSHTTPVSLEEYEGRDTTSTAGLLGNG
jgi:hypothetical protein